MRNPKRYKTLPQNVFYDVLGCRADRWAAASMEYSGGKLDEDLLAGWFAAVIMTAYKKGHEDGMQKKRRKF